MTRSYYDLYQARKPGAVFHLQNVMFMKMKTLSKTLFLNKILPLFVGSLY